MHDSSTEANYRPVEVRRPPFRHRYEVFSPKLERHITLYCWDAVLVRTLIEGIAQIDRFCERPGLLREGDAWQLVDFWSHTLVNLSMGCLPTFTCRSSAQHHVSTAIAPNTRYIIPSHLQQHAVLIRNWQSALPYVISNRRWISAQQCDRIVTSATKREPWWKSERRKLPGRPGHHA